MPVLRRLDGRNVQSSCAFISLVGKTESDPKATSTLLGSSRSIQKMVLCVAYLFFLEFREDLGNYKKEQ